MFSETIDISATQSEIKKSLCICHTCNDYYYYYYYYNLWNNLTDFSLGPMGRASEMGPPNQEPQCQICPQQRTILPTKPVF